MPKYLALSILITYLLFLTCLSLFSFGNITTIGSEFDDKLNHFGAHMVLTILAHNFYRTTSFKNPIIISLLTSVCYGIVIEVLQLTITTDRTFDFFDMLANLVGALFGISLLKLKKFIKLI